MSPSHSEALGKTAVDPRNVETVQGVQGPGKMPIHKGRGQRCSLYGGQRREHLYATYFKKL